MHGQIAAVRGYSLCLLFSYYCQAQNYCEAKYSWKETFGEVNLQAQPEECGVKGQRFIYIYIYFQRQPTNSMVQKIILIHTCTHTCTHRTVCCQISHN